MRFILLRGAGGELRKLSPSDFRRTFGAAYARKLLAPKRLPEAFLSACRSYGERAERRIGDERARLLRSRVRRGCVAPAYIAPVDKAGFGLFARKALRRGEMIGEYTGILTREWTPDVRSAAEVDPYLLKFPFPARYAIDAREAGNETRFINHSGTRPNAGRAYVLEGGLLHVVLLASRPIAEGEQLVLDYGSGYWFERTPESLTSASTIALGGDTL